MAKKPHIYVCTNLRLSGQSCAGRAPGADEVLKALRGHQAVRDGLVEIKESVCMGYCTDGPNVKILGGDYHHAVTPENADALVEEALEPDRFNLNHFRDAD